MNRLFLLISVLVFSAQASADMECVAKKARLRMLLECPDGRTGYVDKKLPTDDLIQVTYKVEMQSGPARTIAIPGNDLKELIKRKYHPDDAYPLWENLIPYLNKKWKTKLGPKEISKVYPVSATVSSSLKLYSGLVENGKSYIPKEPRETGSIAVNAVPIKPTRKAPVSKPSIIERTNGTRQ